MVVMIYPAMQPVEEQSTILDLAKKVEELTKKIENLSTIQSEPVKVVFATAMVTLHGKRRVAECRIFNVTKKLAREMLIHDRLFQYSPCTDREFFLPISGKQGNWSVLIPAFDGEDEKYDKFVQMQRNRLEEFFKELNVPCTVVLFEGFMEEYQKQFV